MCIPDGSKERKRVVVSGAGPAGLLLASLLLNKNKDATSTVTYDVTLLDGREDYGSFSKEELSKYHRSWMLGLADHGMDAIKKLPELYENYVKGEGILVREINIFLGAKKLVKAAATGEEVGALPEGFIVDRNFIVAAIARYLRETHENDPNYTAMYNTKCQYVDYDNRRVLVRDVKGKHEQYIDYDLLVGCDGVRSTVREAMVKRHSDFHLEYTDIFQEFKQLHLKMPESLSQSAMSLLPDVFPLCQGICLPETGGLVNMGVGAARHLVDELPDELKSDDYKVVSEYVRNNLKAFELDDYDDFAKQWVNQRWNQTGMVHCNFYHSVKTGVVLMGDAAHATSPSIGMGMNTALRDAQIFSEILEETKDDFEAALPAYSEARVKEGNALSDLALHLYCMDKKHQMIETIHMIVRGFLWTKFPRFIDEHPQAMIGRKGTALSEVYEMAVKQGIIHKHRHINDRIRQEYFECKSGMIQTQNMGRSMLSKLFFGAGLAALGAVAYQNLMM
eukprot:jgi/Psemu1/250566/estExt_Genewise1Plus.C_180190